MSDLVQKLMALIEEAPHYFAPQYDFDGKKAEWFNAQRAVLSEAKAGGWVAVPVEPTPQMTWAATVTADREWCYHVGRDDAKKLWAAMLAARPLPAPPAQRGEG